MGNRGRKKEERKRKNENRRAQGVGNREWRSGHPD
jgi:hypothetical protein